VTSLPRQHHWRVGPVTPESGQSQAGYTGGEGRTFVDKASGKLEHRPQLDALLDQLRPGDTVVVWRLDRLGRSLRHLIDTVQDLDSRGVASAA
jgi:DNA invertase Pin-like site-specific DNA recombinase